jgi:hypothetical protein
VHRDERIQAGALAAPDYDVLVIEGFEVAVRGLRCRRGMATHCGGDGDAPVALPVDDPVPAVAPSELPVLVPGDVVPLGLVEPVGVVDVPSVGAPVDPVEDVPVPFEVDVDADVDVEVEDGAGLPVEDVEAPLVGFVVLLSGGALTLAPPPLITVEMPPLERSFTFVETVVVVVADCPAVFAGVAVALDPSGISATVCCSWTTAAAVDVSGSSRLALELAMTAWMGFGDGVRAGATTACRAGWW